MFKLSLTVNDLNDNSPVFQPPTLTLRVPETAALGSVYVLPAAVDRDHGPRDIQTYTMTSNATDHFRLHVTGTGSGSDVQLVVVGQLDHESESVYSATVTAVDGGNPAKSGSLDVTILIQVSQHYQRNNSNDRSRVGLSTVRRPHSESFDNVCRINCIKMVLMF